MSVCSQCRQPVGENARFCPQCGLALPHNPVLETSHQTMVAGGPVKSKKNLKIALGIVAILFMLFACLAAGILGIVYYSLKQSGAYQLAVSRLKEDPEVRLTVGEIEHIGIPLGNVQTSGGGTGEASLSMSVRGTKLSGKYYSTLRKTEGEWHFLSGRVQLADGRSIALRSVSRPHSSPVEPSESDPHSHLNVEQLQGLPLKGGRQLKSDATRAEAWTQFEWPGEKTTFRVPSDWKEVQRDKREVQFRHPNPTQGYFIAHVTYFDRNLPLGDLEPNLLQSARGQLKRGEIEGYEWRLVDGSPGLLTLSGRSDGHTMVTWNGYVDSLEYGTKSVTILLGSSSPSGFDQIEPILGAIFESIRFYPQDRE